MKKRMFLSTILMTLVLLVAVTTATFAWYTVTSTLDVKDPTASTHTNINTTTNATAASLSVNVDLSIAEADSTSAKSLVLAAYNSGWYSKFTSNGREYPIDIQDSQTAYKVFEVKAKLSGEAMSNQEFMNLLSDNTEVLTVTAAVNNDADKTTADYKDAVKFWTVDGATLGTIAAPGSTTTMDINVKALTAEDQIIGYVVMYIDGTEDCVEDLAYNVTIAAAIKVTGVVA